MAPFTLHAACTCSSVCGVAEQLFSFQVPMPSRFRCTVLEKAQAVDRRDGVVVLVMAYMLGRWDTDVNIESDQEDVKSGQG